MFCHILHRKAETETARVLEDNVADINATIITHSLSIMSHSWCATNHALQLLCETNQIHASSIRFPEKRKVRRTSVNIP